MSEQAKAIDVIDRTIYRECLESIDAVVTRHEEDDTAAMSIYLSLKVIVKVLEEELGIQPVEVSVEKENTDAA